jgi:uncharacterized NAD(P)/FAD-binding protein YdhS
VLGADGSFADIYGPEFFAAIDGVTNALDNVKARECRMTIVLRGRGLTDVDQVCTWTSAAFSSRSHFSNRALSAPKATRK